MSYLDWKVTEATASVSSQTGVISGRYSRKFPDGWTPGTPSTITNRHSFSVSSSYLNGNFVGIPPTKAVSLRASITVSPGAQAMVLLNAKSHDDPANFINVNGLKDSLGYQGAASPGYRFGLDIVNANLYAHIYGIQANATSMDLRFFAGKQGSGTPYIPQLYTSGNMGYAIGTHKLRMDVIPVTASYYSSGSITQVVVKDIVKIYYNDVKKFETEFFSDFISNSTNYVPWGSYALSNATQISGAYGISIVKTDRGFGGGSGCGDMAPVYIDDVEILVKDM